MSEVNNSATKKVIDTTIERLKESSKEDYEPREDLDFIDVFFPKLCAIYGTKICLDINEGKNIEEQLKKRGLSVQDFDRIEDMISKGFDFTSQNNNSLSSVSEVEDACNNMLKSYAMKAKSKLEQDKNEIELNIIKEAIKDSFETRPNIYTPCSVYENTDEKKM